MSPQSTFQHAGILFSQAHQLHSQRLGRRVRAVHATSHDTGHSK